MLHALSLELLRHVASYLDISDFAAFALSSHELYLQLLSNERYNKDIIEVSSATIQFLAPVSFFFCRHYLLRMCSTTKHPASHLTTPAVLV